MIEGKSPIDLGVDSILIFSRHVACGLALPCYKEDVAGVTYINTNLTISNPINYSINASVACDNVRTLLIWYGVSKSKLSCFVAVFNHSKIK